MTLSISKCQLHAPVKQTHDMPAISWDDSLLKAHAVGILHMMT